MQALTGPWSVPECAGGRARDFWPLSGNLREDHPTWTPIPPISSVPPKRRLCAQIGGRLFNVSLEWAPVRPGVALRISNFTLCADARCPVEEVATAIAPDYFANQLQDINVKSLLYGARARADRGYGRGYGSAPWRLGTAGHRIPPATLVDRLAYRKIFEVCGDCNLLRYGNAYDGGYMMCSLHERSGRHLAIQAAYSYGIAGEDPWSEAILLATGAVVHQYDCFNNTRPDCAPPCRLHFHDECLTHRESHLNAQYGMKTLSTHLNDNGHAEVLEGQLLWKADIEGAEWDVINNVDERDLRKFQQIVLELHYPFLNELTNAASLARRMKAMQLLLQHFYVVHVHPSNLCQPAGLCMEVTLAHGPLLHESPEDVICRSRILLMRQAIQMAQMWTLRHCLAMGAIDVTRQRG